MKHYCAKPSLQLPEVNVHWRLVWACICQSRTDVVIDESANKPSSLEAKTVMILFYTCIFVVLVVLTFTSDTSMIASIAVRFFLTATMLYVVLPSTLTLLL